MKSQHKKLFVLSFLFILLLDSSFSVAESDLASDRRALLALRIAVGAQFFVWNISDDTPCHWTGVTCRHNRVSELRLPRLGLFGQLPVALGHLTRLQTLSLRFNALYGPLPAEIGNLASLRNLYLPGNYFSGGIPQSLFNLRNLVILNLANNNFTGIISPNFNKLTRLTTLHLEGNQLNGSIPYLNLPSLVHFNVSFNMLIGPIPETVANMPASSFEGNSLCAKPLLLCNGSSIGDNHKLSGGAIVGIVISCFIGCLCQRKQIKQEVVKATEDPQHREVDVKSQATVDLNQREKVEISTKDGVAVSDNATPRSGGGAAFQVEKDEDSGDIKKREEVSISSENVVTESDRATTVSGRGSALGMVEVKSSLEFDLEDLLSASAEVLGKGTFGTTYKAIFETGRTVALKRLRDFNVSEKEFEEMIEAAQKMNNQHFLPIRAYYYSEDEMFLVYEYMHMGSLSSLLHGDKGGGKSSLNWETRTSIALGAARGIQHIHSMDPHTCHGNIKSSNIFLTPTFKVRVSEFGLANVAESIHNDGYLAPEVTDTSKLSQKADIYSFGVLLLELLTGKDPTDSHLRDEGLDLPRWMQYAVDDEWTSVVFDVELLQFENVEEIMLQLLELAFSCSAQHPGDRPLMAEVISQIRMLCSSSLQVDRDPTTIENVLGHIPKAWKIYTRRNRELQQRSNPREHENTEGKGLVFFGNKPDVFDLEDLLRASAEVLGKGTYGTSYKATFEPGRMTCVKRVKTLMVTGEEYRKMVEAVGKITHENLIFLRAYYHRKDENLLVQDYMPMGSLSALLHMNRASGRTPLDWETRCGIALGAARAIEHLHSQSPATCHGNIKSSNILLTSTFEVRVSDFGLAKILGPFRINGYTAPEVTSAHKVSEKGDVYSFGVLLMELVTGKAPVNSHIHEEGLDLPRWVLSVIREEWTVELFDVELLRYQNIEEDVVQLLKIAISCTAHDPCERPSMAKVKFQIKKLCRYSSQVGKDDKSLQETPSTEDEKSRFGYMISLQDEGR